MFTFSVVSNKIFNIFNKKMLNIQNFSSKPQMPPFCGCRMEYKGLKYEEMMEIKKKHIPPNLPSMYKHPLAIAQGSMQWLFDLEGKRYLDMFGGPCTVLVGHCHPTVNKRIEKQLKTLNFSSALTASSPIYEYMEQLACELPKNLNVMHFVNSGSEANDLAAMLARVHTGKSEIISMQNGYHGVTSLSMALSGRGDSKYPFISNGGIHLAMCPNPFNGPWGGYHCRDCIVPSARDCSCKSDHCEATEMYLEQLEILFKNIAPNSVAAIFAEPIQGLAGVVQLPKGYLKGAYEMVKKQGGLFIFDEVQTGFGRTGDTFWGFEKLGFIPDIITLAKGIGNGMPLGALIATTELAQSFSKCDLFHTYGGNPISTTAGLAVLEVLKQEEMQENCKEIGDYLIKKLAKLRDKYKIVGDVRGKGFMMAIELVTGKEDDNPTEPMSFKDFCVIWEQCKDLGLIVGAGGHGNVIRLYPPMCITKEDADFTYAVLDYALNAFQKKKDKC